MRKAFTLVEIMIVVAIIGILLAVAIPGFLRARTSARREACQSNQLKIDGAVLEYVMEYKLGGLDEAPFAGISTEDPISVAALAGRDGYLKSMPDCPASGEYEFLNTEGQLGEALQCDLFDDVINLHIFPVSGGN